MTKMLSGKTLTLAAALLMLASAMGSSAYAENLLAFATRANNASSGTTHVFAPLDDSGATALDFKTTAKNKTIKITYNAECGALGPAESWISVTILVDGVQANPASGTSFALCTASSTSTFFWAGTVRQSLITVPAAGTHSVQVLVDLNGAATWWLGDTSLVVEQK